MSFLKWRKSLAGNFKEDIPVDEHSIRLRLREFITYCEMSDSSCLEALLDDRGTAYYGNLEEFAYWGSMPKDIESSIRRAYEECSEAYDDDQERDIELPRLVWWFLEELLELYNSVDWDPEEEWVEYDDPDDIEEYGEGYWHTPEVEDPFNPRPRHTWHHKWDEFFDSLPEELKDEFL